MRPEQTGYYLATEEDEAIVASLPNGDVPRQFPTVVAKRDGQIIGYLGTHAVGNMLLAGPLEVLIPEGRSRAVVALRLIQAYEMVLLHAPGLDHYYYTTSDDEWIAATMRCPRTTFCCLCEDGSSLFRRDLPRIIEPNTTVH